MATISDCPAETRAALRTVNKSVNKIIDIVADTTSGITPQHKADRIAKLHGLIQLGITSLESTLLDSPLESSADTEIAKPIEEE